MAATALCMAVSSAFLFYTDDRLNIYGIGSPLGFGDSITGTSALWLQPWFLAAARAGIFKSWAMSLGDFVFISLFSGTILAVLAGLLVRVWSACFWPSLIIFTALAISSAAYANRNFRHIEKILSCDHLGGAP